jgi:cytochrome bd-type quinol oxidase subunit 2
MENISIPQNFKFEGRTKTLLFALMAVGLVCLGINFFVDDEHHTRFWSNILLNTAFFTGIALMGLFFYAANIVALSGWYTGFKRIWEAMYGFLPLGLILMAIIGLGTIFDFHTLYHWAIEEEVANDTLLQHKSPFLNSGWYMLATVVFGAIWFVIGMIIRNISKKEDESGDMSFSHHKKMRVWAAIFLPIGGFTVAAAVWLWVMSVDPHWYSTLFAWYCMISWLVSMFALTILLMIYLKSKDYFPNVTREHLHDLGKFLFAFSIFWTYLWFSQFMLIWYGNVGEETIYFKTRMDDYPVMFFANLLINFILPFLVLMRNDTKRKIGTLTFVAVFVFVGHWLDYFLMLKPGILHTAHEIGGHDAHAAHDAAHGAAEHASHFVSGFTIPGLLDIGIFVGFLGLFLYFFFSRLANAKLVPSKDPYLEESLHHHV